MMRDYLEKVKLNPIKTDFPTSALFISFSQCRLATGYRKNKKSTRKKTNASCMIKHCFFLPLGEEREV